MSMEEEMETSQEDWSETLMSSDDDMEEDCQEENIDLGFLTPRAAATKVLHETGDWSKWDGGKVGGKPVWLIPLVSPSVQQALKCPHCSMKRSFLLQIYCPLDQVEHAFHRVLYVFCCKSPLCIEKGSIIVLRCQLGRANAFYSYESGHDQLSESHTKETMCSLCNQSATFTCSKCRQAKYCCLEHQKDHWRNGHKKDCAFSATTDKSFASDDNQRLLQTQGSDYTFPEYIIEIEAEPDASEAIDAEEQHMIDRFNQRMNPTNPDELSASLEQSNPFEDDSAIDLSQKELEDMLGNKKQDATYIAFLTRTALAKDQVVRYGRWGDGAPLWVHSKSIPKSNTDIPSCEHCGAPREFEFQIMPQLLYYLRVDKDSSVLSQTEPSFEWGTLAIFTCTNSCDTGNLYTQEFVWKQSAYTGEDCAVEKAG